MRRFFWLSLLLFVPRASAFFVQPEISLTEKRVHIEANKEVVHIEILQKFENTTSDPQEFQLWEPLPASAGKVDFFVDSAARAFELFANEARLDPLFSAAAEFEDVRFFRFGAPQFPNLFRSALLFLPAHGTAQTKLVFEMPPTLAQDFFSFEIFAADDTLIPNFELTFRLQTDEKIFHFLHNLPFEILLDQEDHQAVLALQKRDFAPSENFSFLWSDVVTPTISFPFRGQTYFAHFPTLPPTREIQEITILVDRSGSLLGAPWERVQEWLTFLLEHLNQNVSVRIGFFNETLEWFRPDFQKNTFDFQKEFSSFLPNLSPLGTTDLSKIFPEIAESWSAELPHRATILFTDETKDLIPTETLSSPLVLLHFSENESSLALVAESSGGFAQKLFHTDTPAQDFENFLQKWNAWSEAISSQNIVLASGEGEVLPAILQPAAGSENNFFVGRSGGAKEISAVSPLRFIPRAWGARRIAEIFQSLSTTRASEEKARVEWGSENLDALLALGRTFGIATEFFSENTTRTELQKNLNETLSSNHPTLMRELLRLNQGNAISFFSSARFLDSVPVYRNRDEGQLKITNYESNTPLVPLFGQEGGRRENTKTRDEGVWRQFDFLEKAKKETLIEIAPFSKAQKKLFVQFPEFVASGFGTAREVDFCPLFRCVSVRENFRGEASPSDRAFWRDFDPTHWAAKFAIRAVELGLLEPELNGKLHLDRAIDRGAFVNLIFNLQSSISNFETTNYQLKTKNSDFSDVPETSEFFPAVRALAQKGIVQGYGDGTFRPSMGITRAEAVKILLATDGFQPKDNDELSITNLKGENPPSLPPLSKGEGFSDVSGWAEPWVAEAVRRGMVSGFPDHTFRPAQELTRAEALKLIFLMSK